MKPKHTRETEWQFLLSFLDASNSSVIITDAQAPDFPIIFVNAAFERTTGYSLAEVLGRNCRFLQNDDRDQPDRALIAKSLAEGVSCECLLRNYTKNGTMFWNKLYLYPFRKDGETLYFVGVQHDVTLERSLLLTVQETAVERARLIETLHEKKERMAALSLDLINAQEAERKAVARELHDVLGQRLSALNMLLHRSQRYFLVPEAKALWEQAEHELTELVGLVRNLSSSLRPPGLDYFGLEASIRELLARQFQDSPTWVLEYAGLPKRLPPTIEISVFRIVQESVTNILRHARARHVVVEIIGAPGMAELEVIIRDDGVGFDALNWPERSARGGRLGLAGMRERVQLLGGSLQVDSRTGAGTRIVAIIPLVLTPVQP